MIFPQSREPSDIFRTSAMTEDENAMVDRIKRKDSLMMRERGYS